MANIDLFGTFLDKLSSVVEAPDRGMSSAGSASAGTIPGNAAGSGSIPQGEDGAGGKSPIDAIYERLELSKQSGSAFIELSSLLPLTNNSMSALLSAVRQLEEYGIIKRTDRNLIGLIK